MMPGLIAHVWQSTLFAGAVWLLTLTLRKNQAQVRYWVWFTASAKFLIPFSLLVGLGTLVPVRVPAPPVQEWVAAEQIGHPFTALPAVSTRVAVSSDGTNWNYFLAALSVLWICGFAAFVVCWLMRRKRAQAVWRSATPVSIPGNLEFTVPVLSTPGLI